MNWPSSAAALARFFRLTEVAGETVLKADPALKQSVTLEKIIGGVRIAESLPWADMFSALQDHFADPEKTVSTIEEVLQILAPFIPGVIPFEEAAQVIGLLCKLNLIQTRHGATPPLFGSASPQVQSAPFI